MKLSFRFFLIFTLWLITLPTPSFAEPETPLQPPIPSEWMAVSDEFSLEPLEGNLIQTSQTNLNPYGESAYTVPDSPLLIAQTKDPAEKEVEFEEQPDTIADPIEPVNRVFFHFNDRLYYWVLKPVATGYKTVVPEDLRIGVRNFFSNVTTPVRLVNCLLQANLKGAGNETLRFLLNSTFGLGGFLDPAQKEWRIEKREEDFGQTLGLWGIGPVFYIEWPFLGASSLRDTLGYTGDLFLHPQTYLISSIYISLGVRFYDVVNSTSLRIGEYEDFKRAVLDPYIAKRDAYHQHRIYKVKERK
jgi:phospholipid-binding lipoprotein MlaA